MTEQYIIYVIDTETTGLEDDKHEIIELSMSRFSFSDKIETDQKTWLIKANHPETVSEEALKVNGHKLEDILCLSEFGKENYKPSEDVIIDIEDWIATDRMSANDRVFAGQNPMFDYRMMVALWKNHESLETFPFITGHNAKLVDTKQLSLILDICMNRKREKYNLGSLVKAFSIKKEKAHKADADVRMTLDLLVKMFKCIANDTTKELLKDTD